MLYRKKQAKKIERAGLRVLYECNEELRRAACKAGRKTGTTATIILLYERRYYLWHIGDTRAYRIRKRTAAKKERNIRIHPLTRDHTAYEHVLVRCIGSFPWKQPDVSHGYLRKGETILLCSDGFRNRVEEDRLGEAMQTGEILSKDDLRMRLQEIAKYVKSKGEADNISAVAVRML